MVSAIPLSEVHRLATRYIQPKPDFRRKVRCIALELPILKQCEQVEAFRDRSFAKDDFVSASSLCRHVLVDIECTALAQIIGLHFRGTDKKRVNYPYVSPSYAVYDYYVQQVLQVSNSGTYAAFICSSRLFVSALCR